MRCAAYARYSSDNQREASITDQLRKCREYAESKGWTIAVEHVYVDEAISGAGTDRPALKRLLEFAFSKGTCAFDAILVDDTSRLSRSLADSVRITERLKFEGIRLIAVSQGIDSRDEQSDVMMMVHSLVDSLYIKELGKKTHRGLEGLALRGLHTGGRCFGYRIVDAGDRRKKYEVHPEEARIVEQIFEMAASGTSLKKIAKALNGSNVISPRPGSKKKYDTWCPTAIRDMLRREIYIGRIIWNKSKWLKRPGTNKRVRRPRPQTEWKVIEQPQLRIITNECWTAVQQKIAYTTEKYSNGARKGLATRIQTGAYLLSGFLKCNDCGAHLVIVSGRGGKWGRYGCSQHWNRGACKNDLTIWRTKVENTFAKELGTIPCLDYVRSSTFNEFQRRAQEADSRLVQNEPFVVVSLVTEGRDNVKYELSKTLKEIWMIPAKKAHGDRFYFGVAQWVLSRTDVLLLFERHDQ